MTIRVPLTVRLGTKHVTGKVGSLAFRKEAVGGVMSISLQLDAPLASLAVTLLDKIYIYDGRSAVTIAEGRVYDLGRSANATDGQTYALTGLGPAQHASDINTSYVAIDQSMNEGWLRAKRANQAGGQVGHSTKPGTDNVNAIVAHFDSQKFTDPGDQLAMRYHRIRESGQRLGRISYDWDAGVTDGIFFARSVPVLDNTPDGTPIASSGFNTAGGSHSGVYGTNWTTGRNQVDLEGYFTAGASFQPPSDKYWCSFVNIIVRSILLTNGGADQGCGSDYVLAHWVVQDLLGWLLPEYDGAGASIDSTGTFQIDQMVYPDGISPREILDHLMALEPAFYWTTGPDVTGNGYQFWWKQWPATVRYEATCEDGIDAPTTAAEVWDSVDVRWTDKRGRPRQTPATSAAPIRTAQGLSNNQAILDVGDEVGSAANAARLGSNFLAAHKYPPNAGTLNIARPIRDLTTGRMVEPFEIEPGELIRVRGIESYPDALNASSNDGQTVFRIWAMDYTSDNNTARLELDEYPRNVAAAIVALSKRRSPKR